MDGTVIVVAFRLLLVAILVALVGYTVPVIGREGWDFVTPFFSAIAGGGWQGQFNTDFLVMLILSALWTAWRNNLGATGMALAVLALLFGAAFLCAYLFYLSYNEQGDARRIMVGNRNG